MVHHPPPSSPDASVRVALVDSGVNPRHPHIGSVAGGVAFSLTDTGAIQQTDDYIDRRGHGTALAGILRAKAPRSALYAVKIFRDPRTPDDTLVTSIATLEAGLRWAIAQRMRVVNLSLGTTTPDHRERLQTLVEQARVANVVLVAASPPGRTDMLPAALPGVIGVAGDDACAWAEYRYIEDDPIPFRAHSWPRPTPGLARERNFHGHSCASAHLSAYIALLIEQHPHLTGSEVMERLKRVCARSS